MPRTIEGTATVTTGTERHTSTERPALLSLETPITLPVNASLRLRTKVYGKPIRITLSGKDLGGVVDHLAGRSKMMDRAERLARRHVEEAEAGYDNTADYLLGKLEGLVEAARLVGDFGYDRMDDDDDEVVADLLEAAREEYERDKARPPRA